MDFMNILRVIEIVLAALGLTFSLCSHNIYISLVVVYTAIVIYELMIVICWVTNRSLLSHRLQALLELVLGILLVSFTIYCCVSSQDSDVWLIITMVIGFLLTACLFITAYEKCSYLI